jgi:hypothetical protein
MVRERRIMEPYVKLQNIFEQHIENNNNNNNNNNIIIIMNPRFSLYFRYALYLCVSYIEKGDRLEMLICKIINIRKTEKAK